MVILRRAIDFSDFAGGDKGATTIVGQYTRWKEARSGWEAQRSELREYVYQTDTTMTRAAKLPWMNTTTRPKLCQIRDNLHPTLITAKAASGLLKIFQVPFNRNTYYDHHGCCQNNHLQFRPIKT